MVFTIALAITNLFECKHLSETECSASSWKNTFQSNKLESLKESPREITTLMFRDVYIIKKEFS